MVVSNCVLVFFALFIASLVMQFVRAKKRKRLVRHTDNESFCQNDQEKWKSLDEGFDFIFKDFRKLQIIKRNIALLSEESIIELDRYKVFSRLEIVVTTSMLLFALFAYYICS